MRLIRWLDLKQLKSLSSSTSPVSPIDVFYANVVLPVWLLSLLLPVNQINASNWIQGQRDWMRLASRRIPGQRDRPGTERYSCPEMPGFVVPRDFSSAELFPGPDCPVAFSPGPAANPGDLRDRDHAKSRDHRPSLILTIFYDLHLWSLFDLILLGLGSAWGIRIG